MLEYLRRYLSDPETPDQYNPRTEINQDSAGELNFYLRRYIADPE